MTVRTASAAGAPSFRVVWTGDGKRHQRTFHDAGIAVEFCQAQPGARLDTQIVSPPAVTELVREHVSRPSLSPRTVRRLASTADRLIEPFFGARRVDEICPADVAEWVRWLDSEHHFMASTIRSHFCVLRTAFDRAVDLELIPVNPCSRVRLPRVPARQRPAALTRMPVYQRRTPAAAYHRATGALVELRRALAGSDSAEELTHMLRGLDLGDDD
jgi:hypothetical protein